MRGTQMRRASKTEQYEQHPSVKFAPPARASDDKYDVHPPLNRASEPRKRKSKRRNSQPRRKKNVRRRKIQVTDRSVRVMPNYLC